MFVLINKDGKKIYVKENKDQINTKFGVIRGPFETGKIIESHLGEKFVVSECFIDDEIKIFRKGARPIYQYDAFLFIGLLGLKRGMKVLEAGTGSGCFTRCLIEIGCKVYSFEKRKDFYEIAKENLKIYTNREVYLFNDDVENCKESGFDCIFLDMLRVEEKIPKVIDKLKNTGKIGVFIPNLYNIQKIVEILKENGVVNINIIQIDLKQLDPEKYRIEKFGFPGFFVYGQKVIIDD